MQRRTRFAMAAIPVIAALATLTPGVLASPDGSATVRFGNDEVGSPYPPITNHDASGNGKFNLVPRTITIGVGGTITYDILVRFGIHQPVVYEAGITPNEIDLVGPFPFVNDMRGRRAIGPAVNAATATATWTTPPFDAPGRYLVLCNFQPHFAEFDMYGWVQVR